MSFVRDLLRELEADLAQALGLPAESVYTGRAPQRITRQGLEVWLRPRETEQRGSVTVHPLEVHLRLKRLKEGDQTGGGQLGQVLELVELLRRRYDGARPFARALPALVAIQVTEAGLDEEPADDGLLQSGLALRVLER
ncbi:MAG: hypothetical protein KDD82_10665 [Planctomycetes bacterium]|nr:hypothetical protein [Planctomycetota bacterium]